MRNETTGELVRGRCRATNKCDYCARQFAIETSEMLLLDAMEDAPTLYVVLTARQLLERRECEAHLRQLRKAARRRWPSIRWAVLVEFQRRGALHLNLMVKGVPIDQAGELEELLVGRWCARVDAKPRAQFVGRVNDGAGLVRYISLHFLKREQAPPKGWRGHRYSSTRDYLVRPASVMRQEAKRAIRLKRLVWRGVPIEVADVELDLLAEQEWQLVQLDGGGGVDPERQLREDARRPFAVLRSRSGEVQGRASGSAETAAAASEQRHVDAAGPLPEVRTADAARRGVERARSPGRRGARAPRDAAL